MLKNENGGVKVITGPLGEPMTRADLPPATTTRWIVRRKAQVVAAVHGGLITEEEVREIYGISADELLSWQLLAARCGMLGLRATKFQYYMDLIQRGLR